MKSYLVRAFTILIASSSVFILDVFALLLFTELNIKGAISSAVNLLTATFIGIILYSLLIKPLSFGLLDIG